MFHQVYRYYKRTMACVLALFIALIGIVHIEMSLTSTSDHKVEKRSSVFLLAFLLDDIDDSPSEDDSDCSGEKKIDFIFVPYKSVCVHFTVGTIFYSKTDFNYRQNFAIELQSPPPEQA